MLDRIDDGRRVSVEREVFPAMVADGSLFALDGETYWIDTGTPEEYIQAQLDLIDGLRGEPVRRGRDASAQVDPTAVVRRSVVGPTSSSRPGARVEGAVLLAGPRCEPAPWSRARWSGRRRGGRRGARSWARAAWSATARSWRPARASTA